MSQWVMVVIWNKMGSGWGAVAHHESVSCFAKISDAGHPSWPQKSIGFQPKLHY